jgi:hypothetical protein
MVYQQGALIQFRQLESGRQQFSEPSFFPCKKKKKKKRNEKRKGNKEKER